MSSNGPTASDTSAEPTSTQDEVDVARADGTTAVFRVDRVAEYPKSSFPTQLAYGDASYPSLRLVTCGGAFDSQTGSYLDNIVAFTSLVRRRR